MRVVHLSCLPLLAQQVAERGQGGAAVCCDLWKGSFSFLLPTKCYFLWIPAGLGHGVERYWLDITGLLSQHKLGLKPVSCRGASFYSTLKLYSVRGNKRGFGYTGLLSLQCSFYQWTRTTVRVCGNVFGFGLQYMDPHTLNWMKRKEEKHTSLHSWFEFILRQSFTRTHTHTQMYIKLHTVLIHPDWLYEWSWVWHQPSTTSVPPGLWWDRWASKCPHSLLLSWYKTEMLRIEIKKKNILMWLFCNTSKQKVHTTKVKLQLVYYCRHRRSECSLM